MTPRIPNFFVVGAAKSGTTALDRYLAEHPDVYMSPIKEPSYFARDIVTEHRPPNWVRNQRGLESYLDGPMRHRRGGCVLVWEQYLKLFRYARAEIAIGESSSAYLISPNAPAEIRARIPHARVIMMLRSPIEQAYSTYLMFCRSGRLRRSFSDVIRGHESGALTAWRQKILATRKIAGGVRRFLRTFPPDQVRWYFHEKFSSDPLTVMRRIYDFLEVDPDFRPDVSRRYNEGLLPKAPLLHRAAHLSGFSILMRRFVPGGARPLARRILFQENPRLRLLAADRAVLADYFREDVAELSSLVSRDLSHWLKRD